MAASEITVFPVQQEIELKPGETYEGHITIAEPVAAKTGFKYKVEVVPYNAPDDESEIVLTEELDRLLMADWISLSETEGTLTPNEVKKIPFKILVPKNAPSGGQYATLRVSSRANETDEGAVNIQSIVGIDSVLYAEVAGASVHDTEFVSESMPGFSTSDVVDLEIVVKNNGNVHEKITTLMTVKNALTGEQVYPRDGTEAALQTNLIMPGTMRILMRRVGALGNLGIYNVSEEVTYGENTYSFTHTVTVCPVWFMGLVALTLGVLIWTVVKLIRRSRKKQPEAN